MRCPVPRLQLLSTSSESKSGLTWCCSGLAALAFARAARFARIGSPLNARLFGGLLVEIVALARAEGMLEVFVLTSQSNEAACRLYARTGGRVEDDTAVLFVYPLGLEGAA